MTGHSDIISGWANCKRGRKAHASRPIYTPACCWIKASANLVSGEIVDPSNSPRQWDMWDPWERVQVLFMLARCLVFFRLPTPPNAAHWKVFVEPLMDHWSQATHCCWTQQLTHKEPLPACQILLWPAELLASVSHNPCPYSLHFRTEKCSCSMLYNRFSPWWTVMTL